MSAFALAVDAIVIGVALLVFTSVIAFWNTPITMWGLAVALPALTGGVVLLGVLAVIARSKAR